MSGRNSNAPIATTHPEKLKLTIQGQRLKCSQLEAELDKMRTELQKNTVLVHNELGKDFSSIINESQDSDMTPFMKLFLQEQKRVIFSLYERTEIPSNDH